MSSNLVRPAGLEPATPGLGNRFRVGGTTQIRANTQQINSTAVHHAPRKCAEIGAKVTSVITSIPWVRRWFIVKPRLARIRRQFVGPSIYWARVLLTIALWALVLWALWPTPDPPVASTHWATFVPHAADLS